jgi:caffeoyl-CoA O-methyltransferase
MSEGNTILTDLLYNYVLAQRSDAKDPVLAALQTETYEMGADAVRLSITPDQSSLISLLVGLIGTKYALQVGTFTGLSSISIARSLMPGGKLVCFAPDLKYVSVSRRYWIKAGVQERIDLRLGDARRLLPHYRPTNPLDFVFIDAQEEEYYDIYFEALLPHMRTGGLILLDRMLRGGQVIDPALKNTPATRAIDMLNRKLAQDQRVQSVLLPISDGLYVCRKLYVPTNDTRRISFDTRRAL